MIGEEKIEAYMRNVAEATADMIEPETRYNMVVDHLIEVYKKHPEILIKDAADMGIEND